MKAWKSNSTNINLNAMCFEVALVQIKMKTATTITQIINLLLVVALNQLESKTEPTSM